MVKRTDSVGRTIASNNFSSDSNHVKKGMLSILTASLPFFSSAPDTGKPKVDICSGTIKIKNNNIKTGSTVLDCIFHDLKQSGQLSLDNIKNLNGEKISLSFYEYDLKKLELFQNLFYRSEKEEEPLAIQQELDKNMQNPSLLNRQLNDIKLELKSNDKELQKHNTKLYAKIMDNPLIANLSAFEAITNGNIHQLHKNVINSMNIIVDCNSIQLKQIITNHLNQKQFNNLTKAGILGQTQDLQQKSTRTLTPQIAIGTVSILTLTLLLSFGLEGVPNTVYNPQNSIADKIASANKFIDNHIYYDHDGALMSKSFPASMAVSSYQNASGFLTEFAEAFVLVPLTKYLTVKSAKAMINLINWTENLKHSGIAGSLAGLSFFIFASISMTEDKNIGGKHAKNTLVYFSMLAFGFFAGIVLYLDKHSQKKEFAKEVVSHTNDNKLFHIPDNKTEMDKAFDTAFHLNASNKAVSASPFNLLLLNGGMFTAHLMHMPRTAMLILLILVEGPIEAMSLVTNFLQNTLSGNQDKRSFEKLKAFLISDEAKNMSNTQVAEKAHEILNGIKVDINDIVPSVLLSSLNIMQKGGSTFMDSIVKLLSVMGKGDVYKDISFDDLEQKSNIILKEVADDINAKFKQNPNLRKSIEEFQHQLSNDEIQISTV